jgi:hypothetical protein
MSRDPLLRLEDILGAGMRIESYLRAASDTIHSSRIAGLSMR